MTTLVATGSAGRSPSPITKENDLGPEEAKEEKLPNWRGMYWANGAEPPQDLVMKYAVLVPEEIRKAWIEMQTWYKEQMAFLKHADWKIHSKAKDNSVKLYTRVSSNQLFCMKSVAYVREDINDIVKALCDFDLKTKYDETFDCGHCIHEYMPYDTSCNYFRFKKVLVVSPRDMTLVGK